MKYVIASLLSIYTLVSFSQLNWDKTSYNFGSIEKDSKRWVDFELTNNTSSHVYLMRAVKDDDIDLIYSRGKIERDSITYVRVQINPESIGPFNKKIELFVSSEPEPVVLRIKGSVNYIDINNDPACPDFSSQRPNIVKELVAVVEVLDSETNNPINQAHVNISNPQLINFNTSTERDGKLTIKTVSGQHKIFASAEGYNQVEKIEQITFNDNYIIIKLKKTDVVQIRDQEEENIDDAINEYIDEVLSENNQPNENIEIVNEEEQTDINSYVPIFPNELPANEFAPNNIVFLMDISNSMNKMEKLDLLKIAVKEMVGVMRSFDKIAIITYASSVNVVLPSTSGAEKEKIYAIIDSLSASGLTAGSSGIKKAYEIAFDNFIEDANNQIVITTDGAFNVDEEGYNTKQEVLFNALKGVKLSVVGVKTARLYVDELKDLAKLGRGHYIYIKNESEAKASLIDELKENSKR